MKKLIFGIAAVFCVQICFQVLMSVGLINSDFAAMGSPANIGSQTTTVASVDPADLIVAPASEGSERIVRYVREPQPVILAKAVRRPAPPNSTRALFRPVVITYRGPASNEALAFNNGQKAVPAKTPQQKSSDKSFIAKALPVVKKPYDWFKAVASRLK